MAPKIGGISTAEIERHLSWSLPLVTISPSSNTELPRLGRNGRLINSRSANIDWIQHILQTEIKEFRIRSFQNFRIDVSTKPTRDAQEICDAKGRWLGFDKYDFLVDQATESKAMLVDLVGSWQVRVRYLAQWAPVSFYLEHLRPTVEGKNCEPYDRMATRKQPWRLQREWWMSNRKKFRIMDLPPEVRELIYGYALGPRVEPYPTSKARRLGRNTAAILDRMPNIDLLFCSKRVREEASNILFKYTPFFVEHKAVLSKLLSSQEQFSRIRQLELALKHLDYFKLFGYRSGEIKFVPGWAPDALKNMSLDRLQLYMGPPCAVTPVDWLDNGCQKIVVDWILDAAWPFIRGHPVQLTGYVKESSRAKFEARKTDDKERLGIWQRQRQAAGQEIGDVREYYIDIDDEEGGVAVDETRENSAVIEVDKTLPPRCKCNRRCELEGWTPKD